MTLTQIIDPNDCGGMRELADALIEQGCIPGGAWCDYCQCFVEDRDIAVRSGEDFCGWCGRGDLLDPEQEAIGMAVAEVDISGDPVMSLEEYERMMMEEAA